MREGQALIVPGIAQEHRQTNPVLIHCLATGPIPCMFFSIKRYPKDDEEGRIP
jgi:hypothetical protein